MVNFSCDACWQYATAKARATDGDAGKWYESIHADAHKRQGLAEIKSRAVA